MKKAIIILIAAIFMISCKGNTEYGECVGFGKQDDKLKYELSTRNAVWTAVGIESIIIPVLWALEYAYCPVGKKNEN